VYCVISRLVLRLGTTDTKLPMCGYDELSCGAAVELHSPSWLGEHILSYGTSWREVTGFTYNTPLSVRTHAGHTLKSGIKVKSNTHVRTLGILYPTAYTCE